VLCFAVGLKRNVGHAKNIKILVEAILQLYEKAMKNKLYPFVLDMRKVTAVRGVDGLTVCD
jgi:hypothetical protein